jgi:hypothetical protein
MQRDLMRKRPADVVEARPLPAGDRTKVMRLQIEIQEHTDRWALLSDVRNQERRGYVRILTPQPVFNFTMGVWEMRVARIKQPPSAWAQIAKPFALVFFPLAIFVGVIWWFLLALSATALVGVCGVALLLLAGLLTVTHRHGSVTIEQIQKVTIKGR